MDFVIGFEAMRTFEQTDQFQTEMTAQTNMLISVAFTVQRPIFGFQFKVKSISTAKETKYQRMTKKITINIVSHSK